MQIENILTAHPSIREAAVVAVPDAKYVEVVGAWIVLEPGTKMTREEVRKVVSDGMNPQVMNALIILFLNIIEPKLLFSQNSPAWVWFIGEPGVTPELPKTASGKVMKHVLRGWSKELVQKDLGKVANA